MNDRKIYYLEIRNFFFSFDKLYPDKKTSNHCSLLVEEERNEIKLENTKKIILALTMFSWEEGKTYEAPHHSLCKELLMEHEESFRVFVGKNL